MTAREFATVHFGEPEPEWCPRCAKDTVNRTPIYALASSGPRRIGEYAICDECGHSPHTNR
ncbi:hypothetical protein [Nocardiopsis lucentensis]|uniref:hypothetical protein n=1 Tax=Nocardiopsis lucentensis TaxID=53441 RepID=UPI00034AD658|nr:hypothetical protein [Nocardiopsis lucentensis]